MLLRSARLMEAVKLEWYPSTGQDLYEKCLQMLKTLGLLVSSFEVKQFMGVGKAFQK